MVATNKNKIKANSIDLGYETDGASTEVEPIQSCTIEDVDRSVFELFKEKIPLFFLDKKNGQQRIPVIFSTGERFAILSRKKPLRDATGALILPIISINRGEIDLNSDNKLGQLLPIEIKKTLSNKDADYQNLINQIDLKNQENVASKNLNKSFSTRRTIFNNREISVQKKSNKNIYEILRIPPTKRFKVSYEISVWANFMSQINEIISAILMSCENKNMKTFKLVSAKGYWFYGKLSDSISPNNNFDGFSEEERLVRINFNMEVEGYIIEPNSPGFPKGIRKFTSSPEINFEISTDEIKTQRYAGQKDQKLNNNFILQDLSNEDEPDLAQDFAESIVEQNDNQISAASSPIGEFDFKDKFITTGTGNKFLIKSKNKMGETVLKNIDISNPNLDILKIS